MRTREVFKVVSESDLNGLERYNFDVFRLLHIRAKRFELRRFETGIAPHFEAVAKYWLKTKTADITDYSGW